MISGLQLIEKEITQSISDELNKVGILFRLFSRTKDKKSIEEKVRRKNNENKPYTEDGKLMQDLIGIRIVTYFIEDVEIVYLILKNKLIYKSEEIDIHQSTVFKPKRTNIICSFGDDHSVIYEEVKSTSDLYKIMDNTFELQLRTILSEGWHEIDHNLRYKCKNEWSGYDEDERMLNGIYASLETNDMALKSLFNELAYKHYQNKNWEGLIRNKFRLHFQTASLNIDLVKIFDEDESFCKDLLKIDRKTILLKLSQLDSSFPLTFNNIVYIINCLFIKNDRLIRATPKTILQELN